MITENIKKIEHQIEQRDKECREQLNGGGEAVLVKHSDVKSESIKWLRPDIWPQGKLSLIVGDPGLGKSWLLLDAAARISRGADWPEGGTATLGKVIFLSAEDGLSDTIVPRLKAQNADVEKTLSLTAVKRGGKEKFFALAEDLDILEKAILDCSPSAVIIDPLSAYLGERDSCSDSEMRGLLQPLASLAEKHKISVICLLHLNKNSSKSLYRVGGSIGFVAAARSVYAVVRDTEDEERRIFAPLKQNLSKLGFSLAFKIKDNGSAKGEAVLSWETEKIKNFDLEAVMNFKDDGKKYKSELKKAEFFLSSCFRGEVPAQEVFTIADGLEFSKRTIEQAKKNLNIPSYRKGTLADGGYWVLDFAVLGAARMKSADFKPMPPKTAKETGEEEVVEIDCPF